MSHPPPSSTFSSGGILAATSSDGSLAAVHVPAPQTATGGGATIRHSVKLFDAAVARQLKSTLVATVDAADGQIVELALEDSASGAPCGYLAARLSPHNSGGGGAHGRPDKVLVWDLTRGVVSCTLSSPPSSIFRSISLSDGILYALCVNVETAKVTVLEHDVSPEGGGQLKRKVKCPSLDVDEVSTSKLGLAVAHSSESGKLLAVRLGDSIRIMDGSTGKKLAKCKVRGDDGQSSGSDGAASSNNAGTVPLLFSSDATLLATTTAAGEAGVQIFSVAEGGRPLHTITSSGGQPISAASIRAIEDGKYAVLTIEPTGGCAYLSECGGAGGGGAAGGGSKKGSGGKKGSSNNINTLSTIKCADEAMGVVAAAFHKTSPGNRVVVLSMPGAGTTTAGASVGVGSVEIDEVSYRDEDGRMVQGDVVVGDASDEDVDMADAGGSKQKKRALPSGELVLGPGEAGGEALGVTDRTSSSSSKRAKVAPGGGDDDATGDDDSEDEFVLPDDDATEEAAGATIADRLALLTSEMDRDTDSDDESEDDEAVAALYGAGAAGGRKKRKATSESLSTLLRQALSSNDDSQLEVALHVHDKKVIENSIATLAREDEEADGDGRDDMITKLLGKLVDRLGRKPGRAEELSIWVQTVLLILISGKSMSRREREVAAKLAPLRSMLNERVESLPHLLRLEGRLSLLGQQL